MGNIYLKEGNEFAEKRSHEPRFEEIHHHGWREADERHQNIGQCQVEHEVIHGGVQMLPAQDVRDHCAIKPRDKVVTHDMHTVDGNRMVATQSTVLLQCFCNQEQGNFCPFKTCFLPRLAKTGGFISHATFTHIEYYGTRIMVN